MTGSDKSYLAYMAARILEMRRILRHTGSIYLHCDPTMSHYLKLVMDAVFGREAFRNEIVWSYQRWTGGTRHFQRMHDIIFMFARSNESSFTQLFEPHSAKGRHRHKGKNRTTAIAKSGALVQSYVSDSGTKAMRDVWEISFLWILVGGPSSWRQRRRPQAVNEAQDLSEQGSWDGDLR